MFYICSPAAFGLIQVIGNRGEAIMEGKNAKEINLVVEMPEPLVPGWDSNCDKCLLIGAYKHGLHTLLLYFSSRY